MNHYFYRNCEQGLFLTDVVNLNGKNIEAIPMFFETLSKIHEDFMLVGHTEYIDRYTPIYYNKINHKYVIGA